MKAGVDPTAAFGGLSWVSSPAEPAVKSTPAFLEPS